MKTAAAVLALLAAGGSAFAQAEFLGVPERVDVLHDEPRGLLYISTSGGSVLRYHLATKTFLAPIAIVASSLGGMDLSPDGGTLAVASFNVPALHLVDLNTSTFTSIPFTPVSLEAGTFTVCYTSDGKILTTSTFAGSGWVPLRRYTPSSGFEILRSVSQDTMLRPTPDRGVVGLVESNSSAGPLLRFRVSDSTFITVDSGWFTFEVGTSRAGGQFAVPTYNGLRMYQETAGALVLQDNFKSNGNPPIGAVYSPIGDLCYSAWAGSRFIEVRQTTPPFALVTSFDFLQTFSWNGNLAFAEGRLRISPSGSMLFATVNGGVVSYPLIAPSPPAPGPAGPPAAAGGGSSGGDGGCSASAAPERRAILGLLPLLIALARRRRPA
jgi:hypothetical protein